jgi:hypothetical protein
MMRIEVIVSFGPGQRFAIPADAPMPREQARRWLDETFVELDCEPLRASGKILTVDKVLAVADSVGPSRFAGDSAFAADFARATCGALDQTLVRVEVDSGAVTF